MKRGADVHVTGIVQGVGFRPFIYNLATRLGLGGWVRNTSAGVDVWIDGPQEALEEFVRFVREDPPPLSRIDELTLQYGPPKGFEQFEILDSESIPGAFQPISPDVAVCADCQRELLDPSDRRYRYPFVNCTNCGPRFTIIQDIPYDRPKTTMAGFRMCRDCAREYADPQDRRFHAQPVACPVCGPHVWLEVPGEHDVSPRDEAALKAARGLLADGAIVAVKGLGGFHLACDATNTAAVGKLRQRKLRVDKPFAIMVSDVEAASSQCQLSAPERELLQSTARPVVLLRRAAASNVARQVAPGQDWLGVMLPYTPLHHLLLEKANGFPQALVMTSGNLSEEPIAVDNEEARRRLADLADAFLMHDRPIHVRCDDSVMRIVGSPESGRDRMPVKASGWAYPVRRSRGYVPFPVRLPWNVLPLLAVGAELKNTFCLTNQNYGFMSHHIGDLENYETLRSFEAGISHFESLFRVRPKVLAFDLHPDYLATRYAQRRAHAEGIESIGVQHHHAHIASCMAENELDGSRKVIGVAFDGTGYGSDGAIWGGEFLVANYLEWSRPLHLKYFPLPGGDAAIKKPARTALALLWSLGRQWDVRLGAVHALTAAERDALHIQLERRVNTPSTSSLGRLFDAAAALSGVRQVVNYEAQAAIEFEALADDQESSAYPFGIDDAMIDPADCIDAMLADILGGVHLPIISARFHNGLAAMVAAAVTRIRDETGIREIILSGGVWQNITLLRRTLSLLEDAGFQVYIHRQVPTNDGGLSLGQAAVAACTAGGQNVPGSSRTNS